MHFKILKHSPNAAFLLWLIFNGYGARRFLSLLDFLFF